MKLVKFIHYIYIHYFFPLESGDRVESYVPEGRVYEFPGDRLCPVAAYELYLEKLNPELEALWQKPNTFFWKQGSPWYCAQPLGVHCLSGMMKKMSESARLSRVYTNHCVRATTTRILAAADVQRSDIKIVTGHKRESSLDPYITGALGATTSTKRKLSNILSDAVSVADKGAKRKIVEIDEDEEMEIIMSQEVEIAEFQDATKETEEEYIMTQVATDVEKDIFVAPNPMQDAQSVAQRIFHNCNITGNITINFNINKK